MLVVGGLIVLVRKIKEGFFRMNGLRVTHVYKKNGLLSMVGGSGGSGGSGASGDSGDRNGCNSSE